MIFQLSRQVNFFCKFGFSDFDPCFENCVLIFFETLFRFQRFRPEILNIKYELCKNPGYLRSIWKASEQTCLRGSIGPKSSETTYQSSCCKCTVLTYLPYQLLLLEKCSWPQLHCFDCQRFQTQTLLHRFVVLSLAPGPSHSAAKIIVDIIFTTTE